MISLTIDGFKAEVEEGAIKTRRAQALYAKTAPSHLESLTRPSVKRLYEEFLGAP